MTANEVTGSSRDVAASSQSNAEAPASTATQKVFRNWQRTFKTSNVIEHSSGSTVEFVTDVSDIRLRGMHDVPCLMICGREPGVDAVVSRFLYSFAASDRVPFVIAATDECHAEILRTLSWNRSLLLSPAQVTAITNNHTPYETLKVLLRSAIPVRRLIPYNYLRSAERNMFFGRTREIRRLLDEDDTSFAIAGPSRIGKTSLVKHYRRLAIIERDPRVSRRFYVDFFNCEDKTPDGVARFLAMRIAPSSRSDRIASSGLLNLLRFLGHQHGGPVDLLLDEVDEVCHTEAFQALGVAARHGLCRLVLCGRGALLRMAFRDKSSFGARLDLIRLEPIDIAAGTRLLLEPLTDLGLTVSEPEAFVERLCNLTGCMPHLLQYYGKKLASLALANGNAVVSIDHVEIIRRNFETAQFFLAPLQDLSAPTVRSVAFALLRDGRDDFDVSRVRVIASNHGHTLTHETTLDICHELVISNVLSWANGAFRIASQGLAHSARECGVLAAALGPATPSKRD